MPTSNVKQIAEDFNIPFRTGFEIFPSIDNDSSVQDYAVPLKDSLRYEFAEFDKRPRTFGQDEDAEYVDLVKERPLFRCKLGRASCAIDSNTSTDVSISRKRSDQNVLHQHAIPQQHEDHHAATARQKPTGWRQNLRGVSIQQSGLRLQALPLSRARYLTAVFGKCIRRKTI